MATLAREGREGREIASIVERAAFPKSGDGYRVDNRAQREHSMLDVLMLTLTFGFFALAIGYAYACERL